MRLSKASGVKVVLGLHGCSKKLCSGRKSQGWRLKWFCKRNSKQKALFPGTPWKLGTILIFQFKILDFHILQFNPWFPSKETMLFPILSERDRSWYLIGTLYRCLLSLLLLIINSKMTWLLLVTWRHTVQRPYVPRQILWHVICKQMAETH